MMVFILTLFLALSLCQLADVWRSKIILEQIQFSKEEKLSPLFMLVLWFFCLIGLVSGSPFIAVISALLYTVVSIRNLRSPKQRLHVML